jgi:hypothetical protein
MANAEPLEALVDRALTHSAAEPDSADILRLYLELPTDVDRGSNRFRVRSSFEAAFTDAKNSSNGGQSWIGAIGYLCFFDQLGGAIEARDESTNGGSELERALEHFSDLNERERATLYALRCCLAHDFSLANTAEGARSPHRQTMLRHHFRLWQSRQHPNLISFPETAWDGDSLRVTDTDVDLGRLEDLAIRVRARVLERYRQGELVLAKEPSDIRRRYIFTQQL